MVNKILANVGIILLVTVITPMALINHIEKKKFLNYKEKRKKILSLMQFLIPVAVVCFIFTVVLLNQNLGTPYSSKLNTAHCILSVYFCTSLVFGSVYFYLHLQNPASFNTSFSDKNSTTEFLNKFFSSNYFSFVTFFTIGYGDIVPVSVVSRSLAVLQMCVGFYLAAYIITSILTTNSS